MEKRTIKTKKIAICEFLMTLMFFLLAGCSAQLPYKTYSSLNFDLQQKQEEDFIVIDHRAGDVNFFITIPNTELRIVLIKNNQTEVIQLINPTTGKVVKGSDPEWSPDGKSIAFCYTPVYSARPQWQLGIVQHDGTEYFLFSKKYSGKYGGVQIRWSLDGSKLFVVDVTSRRNFEFDTYDCINKQLEGSISIKGGAKIQDCPVISPNGVKVSYTDDDGHIFIVEPAAGKEVDITGQINALASRSGTFRINALDWVSEEQLLIAMGNILISFDCSAHAGKILFGSTNEIVRVKYLPTSKKLLLGYPYEKGTDIGHISHEELTYTSIQLGKTAIMAPQLFSTAPIIAFSPGIAPLILLPFFIMEGKYIDTTFALVDLDGRILRSFCTVRNYGGEPAWIGNVSRKGRYLTIHVYTPNETFIHALDLEAGNVYSTVGY